LVANVKVDFKEGKHGFSVVFYRSFDKNAPKNAPNNISKMGNKILSELIKNNKITYEELSSILKVDRTTVMRNISKLKEKGLVKRIGSKKGGYWKIKNQQD